MPENKLCLKGGTRRSCRYSRQAGNPVIEYYAAYLISVGIGILAAIIGLGGGFLYVPTLSLIFGLDAKTAIGTSLAIMIFSTVSASFWYHREGMILYRVAVALIVPSMLATFAGSYLTTLADSRVLVFIFCIMLTLVSLEMLVPWFRFFREIRFGPSFVLSVTVPHQGTQPVNRIWYSHLIFWGAAGGLLSGVTGTSGGAIFVPALATAGIPVHYAVATAMFAAILVSITGAASHVGLGQVAWPFAAVYGIGAATGTFLGTYLATRVHEEQIRRIFGILLLCVAALMFQQRVLTGM